jgi:hypothetical protein
VKFEGDHVVALTDKRYTKMIWIILILMLLFLPWPMTLLGVIGFLIGDTLGFGVGLVLGLLWSMVLE